MPKKYLPEWSKRSHRVKLCFRSRRTQFGKFLDQLHRLYWLKFTFKSWLTTLLLTFSCCSAESTGRRANSARGLCWVGVRTERCAADSPWLLLPLLPLSSRSRTAVLWIAWWTPRLFSVLAVGEKAAMEATVVVASRSCVGRSRCHLLMYNVFQER